MYERGARRTWQKSSLRYIKKERVWTETQLKYLALVLPDEPKNLSFRLDALALKKSDNELLEEISKVLESSLSSQQFKEENEGERWKSKRKRNDTPWDIRAGSIRVNYKWLRNQWRKFSDRVKRGSGKAPIEEPEWFTILRAIICKYRESGETVHHGFSLNFARGLCLGTNVRKWYWYDCQWYRSHGNRDLSF